MADEGDDKMSSTELNMTYVALAISLAAFGLSTLQSILAYLQFDNSEGGRRRCSPEVMGKEWAAKTKRKYNRREFRYQIFFEVPVFYTAPPSITVGPLTLTKPETTMRDWARRVMKGSDVEPDPVRTFEPDAIPMEVIDLQPHVAPIYKITGTATSCKNTMTTFTKEKDEKWANVHTAEDEGCSWILLLDALQGQERLSRAWDRGPSNQGLDHTICYLIQRKQRCWDYMPLNATKPFATTTICHLVEIMSMLGMVWTDFDVKASILSAEGNGYMIKSEYMSGLGILARFSRLSKPMHKGNRIIPCEEVKRLCFGEVPSLFDDMGLKLQVGPRRIEACLAVLLPGLSASLREHFIPKDFVEKSVLPAPTFELIAMVAKSCHIPGSRFRRLPNPCGDAPSYSLNAAKCLEELSSIIKDPDVLGTHPLARELANAFEHGRFDGIGALDPVPTPHGGRTLEQLIERFLTAQAGYQQTVGSYSATGQQDWVRTAEDDYNNALLHLMDALHAASDKVGQRLTRDDLKSDLRDVVAAHFTATLGQQDTLRKQLDGSTAVERDLVRFYAGTVRPAVVGGGSGGSHASTASTITNGTPTLDAEGMQRSAVWLALMFRMWAWMFLHEFNPLDKMIERTEFMNSRLPVYIG